MVGKRLWNGYQSGRGSARFGKRSEMGEGSFSKDCFYA